MIFVCPPPPMCVCVAWPSPKDQADIPEEWKEHLVQIKSGLDSYKGTIDAISKEKDCIMTDLKKDFASEDDINDAVADATNKIDEQFGNTLHTAKKALQTLAKLINSRATALEKSAGRAAVRTVEVAEPEEAEVRLGWAHRQGYPQTAQLIFQYAWSFWSQCHRCLV